MATIRKDKTPGAVRWQVRWTDRDLGKRVTETFTTSPRALKFRGLVDANDQRYPRGWVPHFGYVNHDLEGMTLRQWFPRAIAARPKASPELKLRYQRQFDIYVPASIADIPMDDITPEAAGLWVAGLTTASPPGDRYRQAEGTSRWAKKRKRKPANTKPASPKTAHNVFGTISTAMNQAVANGHAKGNVFEGLGKGLNDAKGEQVHLSKAEFEMVRTELRPDLAELAEWAFKSGMRFGEITALQWRDLDYRSNKVNVRRAWKRGPHGVYYLGEPKGASKARRIIVVDPDLMARVQTRDPRQPGVKTSPADVEELVFANRYGKRTTNSVYLRIWLRAVAAAQEKGLTKRPRFHDLRHSHATILLQNGVDIVTVSRRLGHSSVAITGDTYGHTDSSSDATILAAFE